jgi:hypothetical protein
MSLTVTLHVFSGRPDPTWTLDDQQADRLLESLASVRERTTQKPSGVVGQLGYRGFTLQRPVDHPRGAQRLYVHEGLVDPGALAPSLVTGDRELEAWLLETGSQRLDEAVVGHVRESLSGGLERAVPEGLLLLPEAKGCPPCNAADAPAYDPSIWNTPSVQPYNNCYNYANNQITNTFAQPGRATGKPITSLSCGGVQPSAQSDGLKPSSNFSDPLGTGQGWYVALVIWPGVDYHWYRQDNVGCWSHKPGSTAARNTDDSGNPITDPKTANRGPYTDFCTYMITNKGVTIR